MFHVEQSWIWAGGSLDSGRVDGGVCGLTIGPMSTAAAEKIEISVKPAGRNSPRTARKDDDEDEDDKKEEESRLENAPLFNQAKFKDSVASIGVMRLEPSMGAGFSGLMDPLATETELKARHGGGRYDLTARDAMGLIMKHHYVTIAGDPKFESRATQKKWKQNLRDDLDDGDDRRDSGNSQLELMRLQLDMQRAESERRDRDAATERERADTRAREDRERLDRESKDRDERRARELEDSRARDREHMTTMMSLLTANQKSAANTDPMAAFTKGMDLAMKMADNRGDNDDEKDPYGIGPAIAGLLNPAGGDKPSEATADDKGVRLTGDTADKLRVFMKTATDRGIDPETAISHFLDTIDTQIRKKVAVKTETPAKPATTETAPAKTEGNKPAPAAGTIETPPSDKERTVREGITRAISTRRRIKLERKKTTTT